MEFIPVNTIQGEIIYKQINIEDFELDGYIVSKDQITPTPEGYISNQIHSVIQFEEKNTVVINAGVGQGKTYTVMQIAKQYYDQGCVLVFAVPYKSLIDQYKSELLNLEIARDAIFDYRNLKEEGDNYSETGNAAQNGEGESTNEDEAKITPQDASHFNIHLLTINCILGNPGEDFLEQSKAKSDYLNLTIRRCEEENKKAVLILDEIHDGIHNFQQKFIFNLWKWKPILQKILAVSATYNEAAKIVIKYIAELTDNKIQIIESERTKIEDKQSDLYLLLYNKDHYNVEDNDLVEVFKNLLSKEKRINILSYSKSLSEDFINPEKKIGKMLQSTYGTDKVNLCTGDSGNIFDASKCNIGTTFSTGINIRGNDSAFVVLLPSQYSLAQRRTGIFSRGINTLIQALARIRDKSEIYIIMPSPKFLIDFTNQGNVSYVNSVNSIPFFERISRKGKYHELNDQKRLIKLTYDKIREPIETIIAEIERIKETRVTKPSLNYPTLDDYILSDGEQVLYSKYEIFGKDLSIYTFWAAFNDQFLNCRLKAISILNELTVKEGCVLKMLKDFADNEFRKYLPYADAIYGPHYFDFLSDKECYIKLREAIYKNSFYLIKENAEKKAVRPYRNTSIEQKIIALTQLIKKPYSELTRKFYNAYILPPEIDPDLLPIGELKDSSFSDREYLLACFSHSYRTDFADSTTLEEKELIQHYKTLADFLASFKGRFSLTDSRGKKYFEPGIAFNSNMTEDDFQGIYDSILFIKRNDPVIKYKVFSFFQKMPEVLTTENKSQILNSIYQMFRKTFFDVKLERVDINLTDNKRYVIKHSYDLPNPSDIINILFTPKDVWI